MMLDLTAPRIIDWLGQFDTIDQPIAAELLTSILTVSADELASGLTEAVWRYAALNPGPSALYAERHIRHYQDKPNRLFKETGGKTKRAGGHGPPPVPAGRPYARETGSEGIIAALITQFVRADGERFFDHPGPDQIRANRIRHYLVVTDFIGSGQRACANLEAAWQIRSFKSWRSYGWLKFGVVAFSGTPKAINAVTRHASCPSVHLHAGCPVVTDLPQPQRSRIIDLCSRYGPVLRRSTTDRTPLGYGGGGALTSFDHGIPNNAPLLLHTKTRNWIPLFPRRSGALLRDARQTAARPAEIERRLTQLRERRLAQSPRFASIAEDQQTRILLLSALKRRPRTPVILSARTGLPVAEVEALITRAQLDGFVDGRLRLTQAAYNALEYLRRRDPPKHLLPKTDESPYCPEYLRPPRRVI